MESVATGASGDGGFSVYTAGLARAEAGADQAVLRLRMRPTLSPLPPDLPLVDRRQSGAGTRAPSAGCWYFQPVFVLAARVSAANGVEPT